MTVVTHSHKVVLFIDVSTKMAEKKQCLFERVLGETRTTTMKKTDRESDFILLISNMLPFLGHSLFRYKCI